MLIWTTVQVRKKCSQDRLGSLLVRQLPHPVGLPPEEVIAAKLVLGVEQERLLEGLFGGGQIAREMLEYA